MFRRTTAFLTIAFYTILFDIFHDTIRNTVDTILYAIYNFIYTIHNSVHTIDSTTI